MILEQGRIIEFDQYAKLSADDEKTNLLCAQACHLVEKFNLQILFVVQGNGKRRIFNVEKIGWSLDRYSRWNPVLCPCLGVPFFLSRC